MKRIVIGLLLICANKVIAQKMIADTETLRISYNVSVSNDTTRPYKKAQNLFLLLKNNQHSIFFNYTKFKEDSLFQEALSKGMAEEFIKNSLKGNNTGLSSLYLGYTLFYDIQQHLYTVYDQLFSQKYFYTEKEEPLIWQISSDTANFLGYLCQKATTRFHGRNFIAYFSTEIPINEGPYKFKGLPGLILKLSDEKNYFEFACSSIEILHTATKIERPSQLNRIKTTKQEFSQVQKIMFENPFNYLNATSTLKFAPTGPNAELAQKRLSTPIPYNPLELE
ncbi:MAG: GLPGLI family protein [Bacteroidetes bacterium]|nr:GLPGLI family protein [Bacteroidota bacterium]